MGEYLVVEDEAWILCENFVTLCSVHLSWSLDQVALLSRPAEMITLAELVKKIEAMQRMTHTNASRHHRTSQLWSKKSPCFMANGDHVVDFPPSCCCANTIGSLWTVNPPSESYKCRCQGVPRPPFWRMVWGQSTRRRTIAGTWTQRILVVSRYCCWKLTGKLRGWNIRSYLLQSSSTPTSFS